MLKTRRSRGFAAGVFFGLLLILIFGTLGYFVGFKGVGDGWSGFYAGVMITCIAMVSAAIFLGIIFLVTKWVYKGKEE